MTRLIKDVKQKAIIEQIELLKQRNSSKKLNAAPIDMERMMKTFGFDTTTLRQISKAEMHKLLQDRHDELANSDA